MTRSRSAKSGRSTTKKSRSEPKAASKRAAEVCTELGIQPYVLKFWEGEIPQLGDRVGSDRLYGPKEIALAKTIREMVEERRLSLGEVRQALGGGSRRTSSTGRDATRRERLPPRRSADGGGDPSAELRSARARVSQLEEELRELRTVRADHERLQREVTELRRELVDLDGLGARNAGAGGKALGTSARAELDACLDEARRLGGEIEELLLSLAPAEAPKSRRGKRPASRPVERGAGGTPGLFPGS